MGTTIAPKLAQLWNEKQAAHGDIIGKLSGTQQNSTQTAKPVTSASTTQTETAELTPMEQYLKNSPIYSKKSELLEANYNTQKNSINQNKQAALGSAAAAHQKMLKYLPEYNAAMGLYGNGASETAYLEADARYRTQQADITRDYDNQLAQAESAYNQNKMDLYTEAAAKMESDQQAAHDLGYETIDGWSGTADELKAYYEGLKGKVSDEQYADITNLYNDKISELNESETAEEEYAVDSRGNGITVEESPTSFDKGKNFKLSYNGTSYNVEVGGKTDDDGVKKAMENANIADGNVFAYDGHLYIRDGDSVYRVKDRFWKAGKDYSDLRDKMGLGWVNLVPLTKSTEAKTTGDQNYDWVTTAKGNMV